MIRKNDPLIKFKGWLSLLAVSTGLLVSAPLAAFAQTAAKSAVVELQAGSPIFSLVRAPNVRIKDYAAVSFQIFRKYCFAQGADIAKIKQLATKDRLIEIKGTEADELRPEGEYDAFHAWQLNWDKQAIYKIAVVSSRGDPDLEEIDPEFEDALVTTCSMSTPLGSDGGALTEALSNMFDRAPNNSSKRHGIAIDIWSGLSDIYLSVLHARVPPDLGSSFVRLTIARKKN